MRERWSAEKAKKWYEGRPWIVGCNFIPSTAGNQLEFWSAETWDRDTIARELDLAASLGMNAVRIFLHDLAWENDRDGFLGRLDTFLALADERGIAVMPVIFDDCWHEPLSLGPHPEPRPGVHNSIWFRSPGVAAARDPRQRPRLEAYVKGIMSAFAHDGRILAWDLYNELGNFFLPALAAGPPAKQLRLLARGLAFYLAPSPTLPLFREALRWARETEADQPLTSPLGINHPALNRELLLASDVPSFHDYQSADKLADKLAGLEATEAVGGRPLLCTEYLARTAGSTFQACLPVFKEKGVACFNWGLVAGRTQTIYTWADGGRGEAEPQLWYHDVLRIDGTPFSEEETTFLRAIKGAAPNRRQLKT